MEATFWRLVSWNTDPIRSVKFGTVCLHMLCSLLNVLAHHYWVQFSKSTLFMQVDHEDGGLILEMIKLPEAMKLQTENVFEGKLAIRALLINNFFQSRP